MISVSDLKKRERLMKQKYPIVDKMLQAIADNGNTEIEGLSQSESSEIFLFLQKEELVIFHERVLNDGIPPETIPSLSSIGIWVLANGGTAKYMWVERFKNNVLIWTLLLLIVSAIITAIFSILAYCKN